MKPVENPYSISTAKAKALGLYKGPLPKPDEATRTVRRHLTLKTKGYTYLKKIKGRKARKKITVKGYSRTYVFIFRVPDRRRTVKWLLATEWMKRVRTDYEVSHMDLVFVKNVLTDVVSLKDGFVWLKPVPVKGVLKNGAPHYQIPLGPHQADLYFRGSRVWFLLYRKVSRDFVVNSRSALFPHAVPGYAQAYEWMEKLRRDVREEFEQASNSDYFEFQGFLAFALFRTDQKMPYQKKRKKRSYRRKK